MEIGKVNWFNSTKGYGFIESNRSGDSVFVHATAVADSGLSILQEGDNVSYEVSNYQGKSSASNITVISRALA
jgi:cold shock CspA family protein